jgi:D-alanine-D-alanine ligase-like ATP-grasp enzyme
MTIASSGTLAPETHGDVIERVGGRLGFEVCFEPGTRHSGQLTAPDGRRFYFHNTRMDVNGACAAELVDDKERCAYHLLRMGYPVPEGRSFRAHEIASAVAYARALGFPVVAKPADGSSGIGVAVAGDVRGLRQALRTIFGPLGFTRALVQRKAEGRDFRVIVLDDEVLAAYERVPLSIRGDGRRSIGELLDATLALTESRHGHIVLDRRDYRVELRLRRLGLSWDSVPEAGQELRLLETANGSTGGGLVDFTPSIHSDVRALAVRISRDAGLRYCGLDLMTASIVEPLGRYTIVELNASPALFHLLGLGPNERRLAESVIERLLGALTRPRR